MVWAMRGCAFLPCFKAGKRVDYIQAQTLIEVCENSGIAEPVADASYDANAIR